MPPEIGELTEGAHLFDQGAFFAAHEAWEERWRTATDPEARRFLQGLIQVAAAFHKLVVSNSPSSATRLLDKGLAKLDASHDAVSAHGLSAFYERLHACRRELALNRLQPSSIPKMNVGALAGP